jgi:hypothetical protein
MQKKKKKKCQKRFKLVFGRVVKGEAVPVQTLKACEGGGWRYDSSRCGSRHYVEVTGQFHVSGILPSRKELLVSPKWEFG